ncbi:hypothetical protein Cob_v001460 [Colletotrichum orbiculare MAFF 240422]|uniref:Uncharacterized protein n=1 Tax=Colletotrichum orbiculare (strain 104-T / ATCC 96160 / CBS 514.97 / LARS 414 / MAFF 240422) TaxID=1213857 RepID=A0A484G5V3_COLOR|nr:hypothetical protein Cob_v001460 [Colletotrichum orbiculare MAFF 240422]
MDSTTPTPQLLKLVSLAQNDKLSRQLTNNNVLELVLPVFPVDRHLKRQLQLKMQLRVQLRLRLRSDAAELRLSRPSSPQLFCPADPVILRCLPPYVARLRPNR